MKIIFDMHEISNTLITNIIFSNNKNVLFDNSFEIKRYIKMLYFSKYVIIKNITKQILLTTIITNQKKIS